MQPAVLEVVGSKPLSTMLFSLLLLLGMLVDFVRHFENALSPSL